MVARGNNRNNGSNLGIASLNANNALSNSNGSNWRSRPALIVADAFRRRHVPGSKPETPLIAACTRKRRDAVKNVRERSASRAPAVARRRATAPKGSGGAE